MLGRPRRYDAAGDDAPCAADALPDAQVAVAAVDRNAEVASLERDRDGDDDVVADRTDEAIARDSATQLDAAGAIVGQVLCLRAGFPVRAVEQQVVVKQI